MNFVFLVFRIKPCLSLTSTTLSIKYCNPTMSFVKITVSSVYLMLFKHSPLTLMSSSIPSRASRKINSEYILNNSDDKTQPCLTPCLINTSSESSSSTRMTAL
jgi:hypothetical protein|uniref:Uncharacterized protein n=1 Tax=Sipha flava TaxID=143950 RepID=A0A2S2R2Z5_9HEMI